MSYLGAIVGNDPADLAAFGRWAGRSPRMTLLAFNQESPTKFAGSIPYILGQAKKMQALGAEVVFSVPTPGPRQYEAIVAGVHDAAYHQCFAGIAASTPAGRRKWVRLPWEANLPEVDQTNAAVDRNGNPAPALYVAAFRRLHDMAKAASPDIAIIWCPNILTNAINPELLWPGIEYVQFITCDLYYQKSWNQPGAFDLFLNGGHGLRWLIDFAKPRARCGITELGADDDKFASDMSKTIALMQGLGPPALEHLLWWNRVDAINCRVSDGSLPAIGETVKLAFS